MPDGVYTINSNIAYRRQECQMECTTLSKGRERLVHCSLVIKDWINSLLQVMSHLTYIHLHLFEKLALSIYILHKSAYHIGTCLFMILLKKLMSFISVVYKRLEAKKHPHTKKPSNKIICFVYLFLCI